MKKVRRTALSSQLRDRISGLKGVNKSNSGSRVTKASTSKGGNVHSRLNFSKKPNNQQNISFVVQKKVENARKRLAVNQRNRNEIKTMNYQEPRRSEIKLSRGSDLDSPVSYRMGNGTVVGGLRSDQLILQKMQERQKKALKQSNERDNWMGPASRTNKRRENVRKIPREPMLEPSLPVYSDADRFYDRDYRNKNILPVSRGTSSNIYYIDDDEILGRPLYSDYINERPAPTYYVYDDHERDHQYINERDTPEPMYEEVYMPPQQSSTYIKRIEKSPSPPIISSRTRKIAPKSIIASSIKSNSKKLSKTNLPLITIGNDKLSTKPHRLTLDPKVQKEIRLIQMKTYENPKRTPGPGVKNFKIVPSRTSTKLTERFAQEKATIIL